MAGCAVSCTAREARSFGATGAATKSFSARSASCLFDTAPREPGSVSAGIALVGRIDYFPDPPAVTTIDSLRTRYAGGDASSVINRIALEWRLEPWA